MRGRVLRAVAALLLAAARPGRAVAQGGPAAAAPAEPGSELAVAILTVGPGPEVWERFGHNTIIVSDRRAGTSLSYNYGLFDFAQENFILRFIQGRMWYAMAGRPTERDLDLYRWRDRSMWVQELALTPAQKLALRDFLAWNDTDAHRGYRYDYYRDNCSTRVRDALDRVLAGALRARFDTVSVGVSYRWHTRRLAQSDPLLLTGMMFVEGHPVDAPLSAWEEMFLPVRMMDHLRAMRVPGPDGAPMPLVRAERQLFQSSRFPEPAAPPDWRLRMLVIGAFVGGLAWRAGVAGRRARWGRVAYGTVGAAHGLVTGVAALIAAGLWAFTDHAVARQNENLLQLVPLTLALVVLAPALAAGRPWARRAAPAVAAVGFACSALGLALKLLPAFRQANVEQVLLALPIHLGVLLGALALARGPAAAGHAA